MLHLVNEDLSSDKRMPCLVGYKFLLYVKLCIPSTINTQLNLVFQLSLERLGNQGNTDNFCNFATKVCYF